MFVIDGIAYASEKTEDISITDIKLLEDRVIIKHFSADEMWDKLGLDPAMQGKF